jgi:hypothetical protein
MVACVTSCYSGHQIAPLTLVINLILYMGNEEVDITCVIGILRDSD